MKHLNSMYSSNWRKAISVIAFVGWSAAMVLVGSISPGFGISQSQAESKSSLVRLDRHRLDGNDLGEYAPYHPEDGDLMARGHVFYYSEDGNFGIGVWESKPGKTAYNDLEYDELMYVLDGAIVMTDEHGKTEKITPGEGLLLPTGFTGSLAVPEGGVRKIWATYMGAACR
jgi:uncharacterized cupin superfamily protein